MKMAVTGSAMCHLSLGALLRALLGALLGALPGLLLGLPLEALLGDGVTVCCCPSPLLACHLNIINNF